MSLHAFVSLPPCRLFIISASSFCLRLGSPALSHAFSLPLPLFPRIFAFVFPASFSSSLSHAFLLVFPSIFFALFPAASLSSLRLPSFCRPSPPRIFPLRFSMPSPCRLYIYPCVLSSSLSHALREKSLCYDSGFSSDRDSFCLVSGKGASLRCVLFSCGRQGGLPPLLGIKSIYIGVNAIFCKKCVFSMKKIGKCLQIQKKSLPLHPHLRNNGSYKV